MTQYDLDVTRNARSQSAHANLPYPLSSHGPFHIAVHQHTITAVRRVLHSSYPLSVVAHLITHALRGTRWVIYQLAQYPCASRESTASSRPRHTQASYYHSVPRDPIIAKTARHLLRSIRGRSAVIKVWASVIRVIPELDYPRAPVLTMHARTRAEYRGNQSSPPRLPMRRRVASTTLAQFYVPFLPR